MIIGMGRYCRGLEVDAAQSTLIRAAGTLTDDAVSLIRAMHARATADPSDFLWMALASPTPAELASLWDVLGVPPLWLEDTLNPLQRAKVEYGQDDAMLLVLKIVSYEEETSSIETGQISLILGPSYVVTIRLGPPGALGGVRETLVADPELLASGPMAAVYGLMDAIVDDYLLANSEIARDLDQLEEATFAPEVTEDSEAVYLLKRENLELRRAVEPLAPVAKRLGSGTLPGVPKELRTHFHDLGDQILRSCDNVLEADALLKSLLSASHSRQSLQQNIDMRKMAAYAALLAVPTAIAGIYGMNFDHMPELHWLYGYPLVLGGMALAMMLIWRAFKRSGWL